MNSKKALSERELEEIAANFFNSDDDFDLSESEEDNNEILLADSLVDDPCDLDIDTLPIEFEDGVFVTTEDENAAINLQLGTSTNNNNAINLQPGTSINENCVIPQPGSSGESRVTTQTSKNVTWKKKNLKIDDAARTFSGNDMLPTDILELSTPYAFFKYFFGDDLIDRIASECSTYAIQENPNKPAGLTSLDINQYLGICVYMSIVHMPNCRSYWSNSLSFPQIKNVMSEKRFEFIRKSLHFNDNANLDINDANYDRLHKLRPVIDHLNSKFRSIPLEEKLSVDEQMCASKARHHMKQYMPAKPHKWGYKLFILCGVSGFSYKFEIYTGRENDEINRLPEEPNLGASANVVVRLSRIVPNGKNYVIYFDNYYTSLSLLHYLANRGIYSLGTVRRNRLPNCKLPSEDKIKKLDRGFSVEFVCDFEGVDISSVAWKDNKTVCLLSTYSGELPKGKIERYDRKSKQRINIDCPNLVLEYNKHMGGVDLMDSLIGRYHIKIKSKKWYMRLFYHLLDMTLVNAWLLYRRSLMQKGEQKYINLADFRAEVAYCLCNLGSQRLSKRGRPSDLEKEIVEKKKRSATTAYIPPKDVRLDGQSHWPLCTQERQRCKFPKCSSFSYMKCSKCGLHFCLNKNNNCFHKFHTC